MSKPDLSDADLADRIAVACEDRSTSLTVADRAFEPGDAAPAGLPLAPAGRPRGRAFLAAAAVLVVGALLAAVVLTRHEDDSDVIRSASTAPTSTTESSSLLPAPAGERWLAPSSPPLGLALQSVAWRQKADPAAQLGQLFYPTDGPGALLILVSPSTGPSGMTADATVRGHPASVMPSKEDGDRSTTINWTEGGAAVEARFIGMDLDAATAMIESLRWRSSDHVKGFDQPADRSSFLMDDASPDAVIRSAELDYADAASSTSPGAGTQVTVHSTVSKEPTLAVLQSDFLDTDGGGTEGIRRSYDDEFGTLTTSWVDENGWNTAWIDANKTEVSEAQLREVADSLVPTDDAGMQALERTLPGADLVTDPPATTTSSASVTTTSTPFGGTPASALDTELDRLDGSGVTSLHEVADGRPMVVLLWSSWCAPCMPALEELDRIARDHPGSAVVAVAVESTADDVQQVVDRAGIQIPVLIDADGGLTDAFGASAVPYEVLVAADGRVSGGGPGTGDGTAAAESFLAGAT